MPELIYTAVGHAQAQAYVKPSGGGEFYKTTTGERYVAMAKEVYSFWITIFIVGILLATLYFFLYKKVQKPGLTRQEIIANEDTKFKLHLWMSGGTFLLFLLQIMGVPHPITSSKLQVAACAGAWMIILVNLTISLPIAMSRLRWVLTKSVVTIVELLPAQPDYGDHQARDAVLVARIDGSGHAAIIIAIMAPAVVGSGVYDWSTTPCSWFFLNSLIGDFANTSVRTEAGIDSGYNPTVLFLSFLLFLLLDRGGVSAWHQTGAPPMKLEHLKRVCRSSTN